MARRLSTNKVESGIAVTEKRGAFFPVTALTIASLQDAWAGGPPVRGDWRFEPVDGGTRFTYRLRYDMAPPVLRPLLDRAFIEKRWAQAIEASLRNLKARVEGH